MPGLVVAVLNMKGGVGKTTISAHVMREFYRIRSKRVLLIDLDPQFNLTQTVLTEQEYEKLKLANRTIYSAMEPPSTVGLFDVQTTSHAPPATGELTTRLKSLTGGKSYLDLVSGNFSLVKYSIISDLNKLSSVRQRFARS